MDARERSILEAERALARRVALGIIISRPLVPWMQLIPGMFLVDFLRRSREIRRVTSIYLPLRQAALRAAGGAGSVPREANFLPPGFSSQEVKTAARAVVEFLAVHYRRLLPAQGERYEDWVRTAYGLRKEFRIFVESLLEKEKTLRQAMAMERGAEPGLSELLQVEQKQAEEQLHKEVDRIFPL